MGIANEISHFDDLTELARSKLLFKAVKAVARQLTAINEKVDKLMAQEQELNDLLHAISADVDSSVSQITSLTNALNEKNASTDAVDLTDEIALAQSIKDRLEGTAQTATSAAAPADQQSPTDTTTGVSGDTTSSSTGGASDTGGNAQSGDLSGGAVGTPTDGTVPPPDDGTTPSAA